MFATYETSGEANETANYLHGWEIRPGWHLGFYFLLYLKTLFYFETCPDFYSLIISGAQLVVNFRRLYIKGINVKTPAYFLAQMICQAGEFIKVSIFFVVIK